MSTGTNTINSDPRYGTIFSYRVDLRAELPSIGRCLSQGAAIGVLLGFTFPVHAMLGDPNNGYTFLLASWLPIFLFGGMVFGVVEGVLLWAISYVYGRRVHLLIRVAFATGILAGLLLLVIYIYFEPLPPNRSIATTYFSNFGGYFVYGAVFGLTIGSRFRPVYELVRGTTRWPVISGITGFLLRVFVLFSLMEAVLFFIWTLQRDFRPREFGFGLIGLVHFVIATVLIFARVPFWLLLPLAVIINLPIAALITDVLREEDVVYRTITLNYLAIWAAFVLCRFRVPRVFMRQESH